MKFFPKLALQGHSSHSLVLGGGRWGRIGVRDGAGGSQAGKVAGTGPWGSCLQGSLLQGMWRADLGPGKHRTRCALGGLTGQLWGAGTRSAVATKAPLRDRGGRMVGKWAEGTDSQPLWDPAPRSVEGSGETDRLAVSCPQKLLRDSGSAGATPSAPGRAGARVGPACVAVPSTTDRA